MHGQPDYVPNPADFPILAQNAQSFKTTSQPTLKYNCIAWAADNDKRWCWPVPGLGGWWPSDVPRGINTLSVFEKLFEKYGYAACDSYGLEKYYEKVAIYARNGFVQHAARQLPDGSWTSKMGRDCDISHDLHALNGALYGSPVRCMKRMRPADAV
jgi:hypothetical protein